MDALLRCATAAHDRAEFEKLYKVGSSETIRVAAYRGMIETSGQHALKLVTKGVAGNDFAAQTAALQMAREIQAPGATAALAILLPRVPVPVQIALIDALDQRGDPEAAPSILSLATKADPDVRVACLTALGNLGDESAVAILAKSATSGSVAEKRAARAALLDLRHGNVTAAMLKQLSIAAPEEQLELARALGHRADASAVPKLLQLAREATTEDLRAVAVSGSVRLMTQEDRVKLPNAQRIEAFKILLADPLDAAEKRIVLAGLATIKDNAALELTLKLVDDPDVHKEAVEAVQQETAHQFKKIQLTDQFWDEGANFGDFNHDGKMDIVSGPFWYEGPDFKTRHEYRPATATFQRSEGRRQHRNHRRV